MLIPPVLRTEHLPVLGWMIKLSETIFFNVGPQHIYCLNISHLYHAAID